MDTVSSLSRVTSMKVVPGPRPDPWPACALQCWWLLHYSVAAVLCLLPTAPRLLATCYHPTYPTVTPRPTPQ